MTKICGVRLTPDEVLAIIKSYGTFTNFVREKIRTDKKLRGANEYSRKKRNKRNN